MPDRYCVIQGPIITYGQGPNNSVGGFNAVACIQSNISALEKRGIKYIFCIWEEDEQLVQQNFGNQLACHVIKNPYPLDPDHRFKHHYAIQEGIKYLELKYKALPDDLIFKIRSDMEMPDSFWEMIDENRMEGKLLVSHLSDPFYIGDFLYAGKLPVLKKFTESITSTYPQVYHPSISHDIGIKYYASFFKMKPLSNYAVSMFSFICLEPLLSRIWKSFITKQLITLSEQVWNDIKWRDKPISIVVKSANFFFTGNAMPFSNSFWQIKKYRFFRGIYKVKMSDFINKSGV